MRRVLIFGSNGQDGRILFEKRSNDSAVLGVDVGTVTSHLLDAVAPSRPVDLRSGEQVAELLERIRPDEIYYLAAYHHSAEESFDKATEFRACIDVHIVGLVHVLEAARHHAPHCRLFYAGSSQMFGQPVAAVQNETTPFAPRNPYAITKVTGAHACALYRERYELHASVGILYNHESPYRGPRFVTQRIVRGAREATRNPEHRLRLGSLSSVVDWGYAPDYVDAMTRIVSQPSPDDYVIATGEPHSVREFVEIAFGTLGLDWKSHVEEDPDLLKGPQAILVGDATKLRDRTGWRPSINFEQLVVTLVRATG